MDMMNRSNDSKPDIWMVSINILEKTKCKYDQSIKKEKENIIRKHRE